MFAVLFSICPCCDGNSTYKYRKSSIKPPPPVFRGGKLITPPLYHGLCYHCNSYPRNSYVLQGIDITGRNLMLITLRA